MSRSYRKFLSLKSYEFWPPYWSAIRRTERQCCRKELYSIERGDVIFPRYYGAGDGSWTGSNRIYYAKRVIRDNYFTEIRNILNGYQEWDSWRGRDRYANQPREDYQKAFIDSFNGIKRGSPYGVKTSRYEWPLTFEWLNIREVKEAVKNWEGDPLDILYYLTNSGIIAKAVQDECKRMSRK